MRRAISDLSWQDAGWHAAYDSIGTHRLWALNRPLTFRSAMVSDPQRRFGTV